MKIKLKNNKLIKILLSSIFILVLNWTDNTTYAAKNYSGQTIVVDGVEVSYDPYAVNGGVDTTPTKDTYNNKDNIVPAGILREKSLWVPFETQVNNYYCGPASATMLLRSIGYNVNQYQMAALLGTTTYGTNAGSAISDALNKIVGYNNYQFLWQWHNNVNDIYTISSHIVAAIEHGNPVIVNTAEGPGDNYLRGHDTGSYLYHFGVVSAFYNYGNSVVYLDPGAGRFSGFVRSQVSSIRNLSYAAGTRGYVW